MTGFTDNLVFDEHQIPKGSIVVEMKYCEICGSSFTRDIRSKGVRYCPFHLLSQAPNRKSQEDYRALMPGNENQMDHRSLHLPRYDDSLLPIQ